MFTIRSAEHDTGDVKYREIGNAREAILIEATLTSRQNSDTCHEIFIVNERQDILPWAATLLQLWELRLWSCMVACNQLWGRHCIFR